MKQFLRSFLTLLMLVVWASGFAQEVTLDFTNSKTWNLPIGSKNTVKAQKTYSNGTYSITINASAGHYLVGSENKYSLFFGQQNATLTLPAFDFDVEKIVLKKTTQTGSRKTTQNIYVGSTAVSTETRGVNNDQTYQINAEYQAAGNIYVLKVTNKYNTQFSKIEIYKAGPTKTATTLDFGFTTKSVNINETFTAPATLKTGETAISGAVTYTSSNSKVATVNKTTGEVSALVAGTTKITATYAGTSEYQGATAFYELTVVDPNATEVTFDFTNPTTLGCSNSETTDLKEGDKFVKEPISLTNKINGSTTNRLYKSTSGFYLGVYQGGQMELSAADGYAITGISFTKDGKTLKIDGVLANADWSGNAKSLILSVDAEADGTKIKTMTVSFTKTAANPTLPLDENAETSVTENALKDANTAGSVYDVKLTRTLTAGKWNTICLPFDVTVEQIAEVLKSAGNVKEYGGEEVATSTIKFNDATTMVAGKPYLIKPTEDAKELVFKDVTIKNVGESDRKFGSNYKICGTFGKYTMKTDGTELFLKTDGKFYIPAAGTATMKGFRAYFLVPTNTAGAALNLSFGEATGIDGVAADAEKNVKVYNVNGQYVGTNLEALPKGLYIVGGKKVLK